MHILSTVADDLLVNRGRLAGRHLTRLAHWDPADAEVVLDLAGVLKDLQARREPHAHLEGRTIGLLFAKPSTRTRVSFEVGVAQLGGTSLFMDAGTLQLDRGETIRDTAYVLGRYLDGLVVRTFDHADVEELAQYAAIPVVNGLTDATHPCQGLADALTIKEKLGRTDGVRVAYIGDGNNVLDGLADACSAFGMELVAASPPGYELERDDVELVRDPREAADGADVLYTDVWTSMGQEAEMAKRRSDLAGYTIDDELVAVAGPDTLVLHCLPAHCGEEIAESVLYGPQSGVWDQAENRLHVQKALLSLIVR
jgi:ornithine carbamoyltransferase